MHEAEMHEAEAHEAEVHGAVGRMKNTVTAAAECGVVSPQDRYLHDREKSRKFTYTSRVLVSSRKIYYSNMIAL